GAQAGGDESATAVNRGDQRACGIVELQRDVLDSGRWVSTCLRRVVVDEDLAATGNAQRGKTDNVVLGRVPSGRDGPIVTRQSVDVCVRRDRGLKAAACLSKGSSCGKGV